MSILDRYIGKQLLVSSLFAITVIMIILILGSVFQDVLRKLAERPDISLYFVLKFIVLVIPISLSLAVPFSFLTAILLTFSRLSADSEFIAMRMAGLSMARICLPVALLTVFYTGICGWVNLSITPAAKMEMEGMKNTLINLAKRDPMQLFQDRKVMKELPGYLIWAKKEDGLLRNFQMIKLNGYLPKALAIAETARVSVDLESKEAEVLMKMNNMNLMLEGDAGDFMQESRPIFMREADTGVSLAQLKSIDDTVKDQPENVSLLNLIRKVGDSSLDRKQRSTYRTELSMRMAFSVSCLAFALIGVPLGVTAQRRESSLGFVISLGIAVAYYTLLTAVQWVRDNENAYPHLLVWVPNILIVILGISMFRRLNRK